MRNRKAARQPGRRTGPGAHRPTRWRWACPISLARSIAHRSALSRAVRTGLGTAGLRDRLAERRGPGLRPAGPPPPGDPTPDISARLIAVALRPPSIRWRNPLLAMRLPPKLRRSPRNTTRCLPAKHSSRRRRKPATTCFGQGAMQHLSPRRRPWRGPAVHRLHRQQHRNPR